MDSYGETVIADFNEKFRLVPRILLLKPPEKPQCG